MIFTRRPSVCFLGSSTFRIFTAITFFQHHDVVIQPNHRPPASKQHNFNRIKAERPESNRRPESDSVSFPLAYIPHNPDSRVSKVFNVSCLPRVVSGVCPPIYLLQGGAYCLYDRIDSNGTCRKLHPLFNLQIPLEPVSVKDTYPRKEESMKKNVYVKWRQPLTNLPYEYILPQSIQKVVVHVLAN